MKNAIVMFFIVVVVLLILRVACSFLPTKWQKIVSAVLSITVLLGILMILILILIPAASVVAH